MRTRLAVAAALIAPLCLAQAPVQRPELVVLKAARLFDGTSDRTLANGVIVVLGTRIKAVGAGVAVPAGASVIDLGDATLLPGFIDAHVHLTGEFFVMKGGRVYRNDRQDAR